jgi:two-component system cell cycle sensor histidine kinase PleC
VVSDVLDIAKIESGTFSLNINPTYIDEVIESSLALMSDAFRAKAQRFERRLPADLPCLPIDARRVKQILLNLLSNANKFTPERGQIMVSARRNADGGATIAIVDTGVGMTPEHLAVALTPFGQVQSHYTRTAEGAGLGLPIAAALARLHGGDLYLESEPEEGTTAVLRLPGELPVEHAPRTIMAGGGERRRPRKRKKKSEG